MHRSRIKTISERLTGVHKIKLQRGKQSYSLGLVKRRPPKIKTSTRIAPLQLRGRGVTHPSRYDAENPRKIFVLHDNEARQQAANHILREAILLPLQRVALNG